MNRVGRWWRDRRIARQWVRDLAGHDDDTLSTVHSVFQRAELRRAAQEAHVHDRMGDLLREVCAACGDAFVVCSQCDVALCECSYRADRIAGDQS